MAKRNKLLGFVYSQEQNIIGLCVSGSCAGFGNPESSSGKKPCKGPNHGPSVVCFPFFL